MFRTYQVQMVCSICLQLQPMEVSSVDLGALQNIQKHGIFIKCIEY